MPRLALGGDQLVVAPEHGGAIVEWTRYGTPMLRRLSLDAAACFPLVPYCNRIGYRHFAWLGQTYELAANFGDHPHAIHGVGWQRPWQLDDISAAHVTLSLRHEVNGDAARAWPFAFASRLTYRLDPQGLTIEIEATNLHSVPVPMGIGVHPYFPRDAGAEIAFEAEGMWLNRDNLPITHETVPNHKRAVPVDRELLDNCFTGWHGEARLPGMRIEADPVFGNLQVFTPTGADFFCVEPVSHVPDAINRPELPDAQGMTVIGPGHTLRGSVILSPGRPGE